MTTTGSKHVVHDTDTYVPYEIRIQALNDHGAGPTSNVATGYSGEDSELGPSRKHEAGKEREGEGKGGKARGKRKGEKERLWEDVF